MFGNMFGDLEEKQKALKEKLADVLIDHEVGDGAIRLQADANRRITNIRIDPDKVDPADTEQVEDLLVVGINELLQKAAEKEAEAANEMMKDMLPPGLGDLGKLFGQ
jgi:DNA-binding protein YbaB